MNNIRILLAIVFLNVVLSTQNATGERVISTVAGNGVTTPVVYYAPIRVLDQSGFSGDGVAATETQLNFPADVAFDTSGNFYTGDSFNHRIRKVAVETGIITTVAGNGTAGFSGDVGVATGAALEGLSGLAVATSGDLYIIAGNRIRKVTAWAGTITTVAGTGTEGFSGDGGAATAAQLASPSGIPRNRLSVHHMRGRARGK